jgi:hypothetical protein
MYRPIRRYIGHLRHAIKATFHCGSVHLETYEVVEVSQGKVVWEGNVELFKLYGAYFGQGCYAWGYFDDQGGWEAVVVLQKPPIRTAEDAVRAAIVKQAKDKAGEASPEP